MEAAIYKKSKKPFNITKNHNKDLCNRLFTDNLLENIEEFNPETDVVIVLDSKLQRSSKFLLTTDALIRRGFTTDNILLIETDPEVVKIHSGFAPCHQGTVSDFASAKSDKHYKDTYRIHRYFGAYFDFTGQIHKQKLEVFNFLLRHDLSKSFSLSVTFTKRISMGPGCHTSYEIEYRVFEAELFGIMSAKGLKIESVQSFHYSGTGDKKIKQHFASMASHHYLFVEE